MTKPLFQCTIEGFYLIPKRRSPGRTAYKPGSPQQKYLTNKSALAWEFGEFYKGPPLEEILTMACSIHLPHNRRADIDNLLGTVLDALQDAGVIKDDKQIEELKPVDLFRGQKTGRVVVSLRKLDNRLNGLSKNNP